MNPTDRPELRRFIERTKEGMQRPPIFEASDGHRYVLKLDTADADFPVAELVSAHLADALGVRLPRYEVLDTPKVLIDAFLASGDRDLGEFAASFARRGRCCFGSRHLDGMTVKWNERHQVLVPGAGRFLANVFVFDGYIENGDRTSTNNPNLLVNKGVLYAIDHGQALPSVQGVTSSLPFPFDSHLGWATVTDDPDLLDEPVARLTALADEQIDASLDAVPDTWWSGEGRKDLARRVLRERRERLPAILEELKERLA